MEGLLESRPVHSHIGHGRLVGRECPRRLIDLTKRDSTWTGMHTTVTVRTCVLSCAHVCMCVHVHVCIVCADMCLCVCACLSEQLPWRSLSVHTHVATGLGTRHHFWCTTAMAVPSSNIPHLAGTYIYTIS